jgi:adenosylmethionine-8-amino-7-oxononanoate aminotransferase
MPFLARNANLIAWQFEGHDMLSNSLVELDREHLIHPVASYRGHENRGVTVLQSASGVFVKDASGHELIDGFAGLWCVNAGDMP